MDNTSKDISSMSYDELAVELQQYRKHIQLIETEAANRSRRETDIAYRKEIMEVLPAITKLQLKSKCVYTYWGWIGTNPITIDAPLSFSGTRWGVKIEGAYGSGDSLINAIRNARDYAVEKVAEYSNSLNRYENGLHQITEIMKGAGFD